MSASYTRLLTGIAQESGHIHKLLDTSFWQPVDITVRDWLPSAEKGSWLEDIAVISLFLQPLEQDVLTCLQQHKSALVLEDFGR